MSPSRSSDEQRPRGQLAPVATLKRPSRKQRAEEIERLATIEGLEVREIAQRVGLASQTVYEYLRDPDGEQARRRRDGYRVYCHACGARLTDGSRGRARGPRWCQHCEPQRRRRWSDDDMLQAIREWTQRYGEPPTIYDWSPAHAPEGHRGAERYRAEPGRWPNARTVARRFGTLAAAVRCARATS